MDPHALGQYCRYHRDIWTAVYGNYRGDHTGGIGATPSGEGYFMVRVPDGVDHSLFPKTVKVNGESIPVVIEGGLKERHALKKED